LNEERLLLRGAVLVSAIISTQLSEKGVIPELTPHCLNVIKDGQHKILAIWIVIHTFTNVSKHTGEEFLNLHGYLRPFRTTNLKKLNPVMPILKASLYT
jgi:hypothetical protein